MKQLFVTDLDGTLLSTDSRVSPESARIIAELTRRGALISVATARTPATVGPLLRNTGITLPMVVMTGAALWERTGNTFIDPHFMTDETATAITATLRRHGLNPMTYTIGPDGIIHVYFHGTPTRSEQKFIDERSHLALKRYHLLPADTAPASYPATIIIFVTGPIESVNACAEELRRCTDCSVSAYPDIFSSDTGVMDIYAPGVSKAAAVTELKKRCGADELIVFGDNLNDLSMMAVADRAVAVGNALPEVQRKADEVIGPNSTDSVARYIADHFRP